MKEKIVCQYCGNKLNTKKLCGYHNKPICTDCNRCEDCGDVIIPIRL